MVVQARFQIRHRGCFTERMLGARQMLHLSADPSTGVSLLRAGSEAEMDAALEDVIASHPDIRVLDRAPTDAVLRCRRCEGGVIEALQAMGCGILWPVLYADGVETYQVVVPTRSRLSLAVERLREMGDVNLLRVSEGAPDTLSLNVSVSDVTREFTQRQLDVLRHALAAGYYDSPRRAHIADLAAAFGISRSTMEEHLRKAENRVMESFGALLVQNPGLLKVTARGRAHEPKGGEAARREPDA